MIFSRITEKINHRSQRLEESTEIHASLYSTCIARPSSTLMPHPSGNKRHPTKQPPTRELFLHPSLTHHIKSIPYQPNLSTTIATTNPTQPNKQTTGPIQFNSIKHPKCPKIPTRHPPSPNPSQTQPHHQPSSPKAPKPTSTKQST